MEEDSRQSSPSLLTESDPEGAELVGGEGPSTGSKASTHAGAAPPASEPSPLPLRILLVDDSDDSRALVQAYLCSAAHLVECAENGAVGVERFKAGDFDLVLMDVQMPVLDGSSAATAIRSWERRRSAPPTPILALTACARADERERCLAAGCDAHISKPVRKDELLEAIAKHAGHPPLVIHVDDDIRDLVDGFLENRRSDVEALRAALRSDDFETVRVLGHNMKGVGRNYGFEEITRIGVSLERASGRAASAEILKRVDELEDYLGRVRVS